MDTTSILTDDTNELDHQSNSIVKNFAQKSDSERDDSSNQEVEEFSSFDISDDDITRPNKTDPNSTEEKPSTPEYKEEIRSNLTTANSDLGVLSTPMTSKLLADSYNYECPNNMVRTSTKPSSRISSDTFETPKTMDTRASTMTSNAPSEYSKPIHSELSLPSATLIQMTKSKKTNSERNKVKTPMKRLSRQNNLDISTGRDLEYNPSFGIQSLDTLFEKMSLDNNHSAFINSNTHLTSATNNDIIDLQNQLTNCKIQIKLQNDLLRDKIYQSIADAPNKQELSQELERKIFNSINSSKMKFQLSQTSNQYKELKQKYDELLAKNNELIKSIEMLRDEVSDLTNNQHDWQNKINELVLKLKNTLLLESPSEINNFQDILNTLSDYIDQALRELLELRKSNSDHIEESSKQSASTSKLIEQVKQRDEKLVALKDSFTKKLNAAEHQNFNYKSQLFDNEKNLKIEKTNYAALESKYNQIKSQYDTLQKELNFKKSDDSFKTKKYELEINDLKRINSELSRSNDEKSANFEQLFLNMKTYHSVILNLLMKIIDPASSGKVIDACNQLDSKSSYNNIQKIFSVAHNYEIDSLSTILDNYQALMKERETNSFQSKTISELQGEVMFLTQKINDLENMKDSETVRIRELETQNAKLREIANEKTDNIDQLKKLRLTDLNKKWKAAEEALSHTKKGAQLKISELEEELHLLKAQLDQQGNM